MQGVFAFVVDLIDIDGIIVRANCQVVPIGRIRQGLAPFSRLVQRRDSPRKVVVVKDVDVSIVIAHSDMSPSRRIGDSSTLLLNRMRGKRRSRRLDLIRLIWLASHQIKGPDFALLEHGLVFYAILVDKIIISTCKESSLILDNLKTPGFTIAVRGINQFFVCSIDVYGLDLSIVVTDENLSV